MADTTYITSKKLPTMFIPSTHDLDPQRNSTGYLQHNKLKIALDAETTYLHGKLEIPYEVFPTAHAVTLFYFPKEIF